LIALKTTADHLRELAQAELAASRDVHGNAFEAAAQDHAALQDHAERLQGQVERLTLSLDNFGARQDKIADVLFSLMDSRIEARMMDILENESIAFDPERVRTVVRDMISDGELAINVDVEAYAELT
jgi:hypothetical protein